MTSHAGLTEGRGGGCRSGTGRGFQLGEVGVVGERRGKREQLVYK